jgi:hypothetical protein
MIGRRFGARKVLLSGDEIPVAHGMAAPRTGLHVGGAEGLNFVLDAPGHAVLVAWQQSMAPDSRWSWTPQDWQ